MRGRAAWNSFVIRCGAVRGSRSAATKLTAPAADRYTAGARGAPVLESSHAPMSGVVPPSSAIPRLCDTETTVHRTRHGASSAMVAGRAPLPAATSRARPTSPAMILPVVPRAMSDING